MAEDVFNEFIIAATSVNGRRLTKQDLKDGLSRDQTIELCTNANLQRQLGFVLDLPKDYAKVFATDLWANVARTHDTVQSAGERLTSLIWTGMVT